MPEHPRNLADQLTLFKPRGADNAPHTSASPPGFKKLSTPLIFFHPYFRSLANVKLAKADKLDGDHFVMQVSGEFDQSIWAFCFEHVSK